MTDSVTTPFVPTGVDPAAYIPPQGIMSIPEIAGQAEVVVKNVMRVEPMLAGLAGMFVPGLSLVQPWIVMLAPYLERALDDISKNNNTDVLSALIELIQHITRGQPNSGVLDPSAPAGQFGSPSGSPSHDASAKGGG